MEEPCEGLVLLVGDGDLSFALSLLKHSALDASQVTTSNLETADSIQQHKLAATNMAELESIGASVLLPVDARELHTHPVTSKKSYARIIFNFPLVDRHHIKKNRDLLADFFFSCRHVLVPEGHVMVTLCKGQGGSPADQPRRSWQDSWQVQAMAANAGFVLTDVFPFDAAKFPEYHSVGFRFQDKSFNTTGSLTHVFQMSEKVDVPAEVKHTGSLAIDGSTYSCSNYIATRLTRNLLEEQCSPVSVMKAWLEDLFRKSFNTEVLQDHPAYKVLPGYKSQATLSTVTTSSSHGSFSQDSCHGDDSFNNRKRQKDEENLTLQKKSALLHGVDSSGGSEGVVHKGQSKGHGYKSVGLVPDTEESVYVLIKSLMVGERFESEVHSSVDRAGDTEGERFESEIHSSVDRAGDTEGERFGSGTGEDDLGVRVFHMRSSLLENITRLLAVKPQSSCYPACQKDGELLSAAAPMDMADGGQGELTGSSQGELTGRSQGKLTGGSVVLSGQCCWPCPIQPNTVPVHHQMAIVTRLDSLYSEQLSVREIHERNLQQMLLSLNSELSPHQTQSIQAVPMSETVRLSLEGPPNVDQLTLLCGKLEGGKSSPDSASDFAPLGLTFSVNQDGQCFSITLLHLDSLACYIWSLPDPTLLWSNNPRVTRQFTTLATYTYTHTYTHSATESSIEETNVNSLSPKPPNTLYRPVSLYPLRFSHDLSFWEPESSPLDPADLDRTLKGGAGVGSPSSFCERALLDTLRCVCGDSLRLATLIDTHCGGDGRWSRCYRLGFQVWDRALPYSHTWRTQSRLRLEVARRLKVTLR